VPPAAKNLFEKALTEGAVPTSPKTSNNQKLWEVQEPFLERVLGRRRLPSHNKHRIAVREKPVPAFYGDPVRFFYQFQPAESGS
jgi:hypothetical protein